MPKRKLLLLAVAGLVALLTVLLAHSMMQPSGSETAKPVATTEVLAATRDLPTGTILKEIDLKWIPWAATADSSQLFLKGKSDMASAIGGVLRDSLRADEPLLMGRVVQPREHGFLAAVLTPGKRAVAVTLTPSGDVAGFIFPGDHVDVLLTHRFVIKNDKGENEQNERALSETVVTDARVLAIDQKSDNQSTDPKVAQLATLEVTPKQAEQLTLAIDLAGGTQGHGSISLVLRSLANENQPADNMLENSPAAPIAAIPDVDKSPTMDSDISPVFPRVVRQHKVHIMRGKDSAESIFQNQQ